MFKTTRLTLVSILVLIALTGSVAANAITCAPEILCTQHGRFAQLVGTTGDDDNTVGIYQHNHPGGVHIIYRDC
ncbi:hypothetical protein LCGC14_1826020 [marine sediment metagenome]|uniref:Uncharacterized protein n=1 Tax=marine sediment metagenome TaxID=412755 RepID=A0A0F9JH26_9ZZZZ